MSAQRSTRNGSAPVSDVAYRRQDMTELRARRREARRRVRLARIDLGLGVFGAVCLWVLTPGLAISSLIGGAILVACVASVVVERRKRARAKSGEPRASGPRRRAGAQRARHSADTAVERPGSTR
jgi:hypothetical protein